MLLRALGQLGQEYNCKSSPHNLLVTIEQGSCGLKRTSAPSYRSHGSALHKVNFDMPFMTSFHNKCLCQDWRIYDQNVCWSHFTISETLGRLHNLGETGVQGPKNNSPFLKKDKFQRIFSRQCQPLQTAPRTLWMCYCVYHTKKTKIENE